MKNRLLTILILITQLTVVQAQLKYNGGDGCGASMESTTGVANYSYRGGDVCGYEMGVKSGVANYSYRGGESSGYDLGSQLGVANYSYRGGDDDGYSHILFRTPFIWTGAIGTSWTVSGNWNYNLIPGIFRPVIIPAGVPNWPFVNAGLFAIGDNPNGSNYRCASLWIQENAFLQTRINCRVENYGLVTIDGEMRVKKITADAFQNFAPGVVIINQGGELKVRP